MPTHHRYHGFAFAARLLPLQHVGLSATTLRFVAGGPEATGFCCCLN